MWWSKPRNTVEDLERQFMLEERTRVLKARIAELNQKIGREEPGKLSSLIIQETSTVESNPIPSERDLELEGLRAKLRGVK